MTRRSVTTPSAERYLHYCSFRSEENQRTEDKLITLIKKVCCQLTQERGDPCTNIVRADKNQVATWKTKQSGFSLKDKKSKFSLILQPRFRNTTFKPKLIGEVSKNWMELSSLNEVRLIALLQVMNNFDEINYFFKNKLSEQNRDFR